MNSSRAFWSRFRDEKIVRREYPLFQWMGLDSQPLDTSFGRKEEKGR